MCHLILLPLTYSNHQIIIISIILFCGSYRLSIHLVHGVTQTAYITNHTEKLSSKLKPNDEIIIRGELLQPPLFIDLKVNTENIPFHLKFSIYTTVFNSKHKNVWLGEIQLTTTPLIVNTSFIIDIYINGNDGYNISFNEQMFYYVKQRESLENVNQLDIYGNVTLRSVKIIHSSKEDDNSMTKTLIIGIAATFVVIIIAGMGIFYVSRRHCIHANTKNTSNNDRDSVMESLGSHRTGISNITALTGNSFLSK